MRKDDDMSMTSHTIASKYIRASRGGGKKLYIQFRNVCVMRGSLSLTRFVHVCVDNDDRVFTNPAYIESSLLALHLIIEEFE